MRRLFFIFVLAGVFQGCLDQKKQAELIFRHYLDQKTGTIHNYSKESSLASWNASISGKESDYKKLIDIELDFSKSNRGSNGTFSPDNFSTITRNVFTNEDDFELLSKLKHSGLITDTLLSRQLIYLYHTFTSSQIESDKYKKLLESGVKLSGLSSSLKYELDGKLYRYRQLDSLRKSTNDSRLLERIMDSHRQGAQKIAPEIINLVKGRNEIARILGYPDYYHVQFESKDESPEEVKLLIGEIEQKTAKNYLEAKRLIDKNLAKYYHIEVNELRPWHYIDERISYLPKEFTSKLDSLLSPVDPVKRAANFFDGIGLNIQPILDKSELRNGSMNVMFNIDFRNDIRLIGRINNSFDGLTTIMHLGGHAAHHYNISGDIPYLLQGPSLIVAEGIARYFENMAYNPQWLAEEIVLDENTKKEITSIMQQFKEIDQLFRIRKQMVIAEFEREIFSNPDQDLDHLWRKLNIKYLDIYYPEDKGACYWATYKYFTSLSCYVQNYILADVVAAQLKHAVETNVLQGGRLPVKNNKGVGEYLIKNLFTYGDLYPWKKLIKKSTGEPLNSTYFVNELIGNKKEN
jgi:peptidyl-dipeptidase A